MEEYKLVSRRKSARMREGYTTTRAKPPISTDNVLKLARAFSLPKPQIFAYNHGYRNHSFGIISNGKQYNLILLKNEPNALERIQNADAVAALAARSGLPTRTLAHPKTLKITTAHNFRLVRLYHWLPGDTIPWEAYTQKHLKVLGQTLANLHTATTTPIAGLPVALSELSTQNQAMQAYFARPAVVKALATKLRLQTRQMHGQIAIFLTSPQITRLPTQPLHLDFVRGNILWASAADSEASTPPQITGIIDFEKTAMGSPLIDLARTYAFLLVDCPKPETKITKYFLQSGYIKYGGSQLPLMPKIFYNLTNYFLIFDFYKFLSHNPYESLELNYHFCRTRDILLTRNILEEL